MTQQSPQRLTRGMLERPYNRITLTATAVLGKILPLAPRATDTSNMEIFKFAFINVMVLLSVAYHYHHQPSHYSDNSNSKVHNEVGSVSHPLLK